MWKRIAPSFDRTRQRAWGQVLAWARTRLPEGGRMLDLACGNGRHGGPLAAAGAEVVGADFSRPLLGFAKERGVTVVEAEAGHLPFRRGSFDCAVFVAGLHTIPGRGLRLSALAELRRVLAPGAPALVTAWSRWQPGWITHFLKELPHHLIGDADHAFGDALVPWRAEKGAEHARYYHYYTRFELREDLRASGFAVDRIRDVRLTRGSVIGDNLFADVRAI